MTDAEYRAQVRRIKRLLRRWTGPLGLDHWRLAIVFDRTGTVLAGTDWDNGHVKFRTVAMTTTSWEYLIATITFSLPVAADHDDDELEESVVHELAHVLVREMREDRQRDPTHDTPDHEERVCTALARAFLTVRKEAA